jgi:hypothetical protein
VSSREPFSTNPSAVPDGIPVNQGLSGQESRNANWAARRAKWQVSLITPATFRGNQQQFIDLLESFFDAVKGRSDAFRLYDHVRFQATNQPLISYNSNTQLAITRTIGGRSIVRVITKPITAAVSDYQGNALPTPSYFTARIQS